MNSVAVGGLGIKNKVVKELYMHVLTGDRKTDLYFAFEDINTALLGTENVAMFIR